MATFVASADCTGHTYTMSNFSTQIGKQNMSQIKTYTNKHGRTFQCQQHDVFDRCANGIYQVSSLRYLRDLVPNARRIIDVGANVGTNTMEYATWAQQVEAFECQDSTFALLQHNVETNRARGATGVPWYKKGSASTAITGDITLHRTALMDRVGTAFVTEKADGLASFVRYEQGQQLCATATIDSFGWTNVDIIKADTEGSEWLIIQGAKQTIERCRPVVQVEVWDWERKNFGLNNQHMLDYFRSINYRQTNNRGDALPWDFAGCWNKARARAAGHKSSAMDRFFVPN